MLMTSPGHGVTLHVDAQLRLPLEQLVRDVASRYRRGLHVLARDLPDGVHGAFRPTADGLAIVLIGSTTPDPASTFLHELAHAIDALGPDYVERTEDEREAFAEALAQVLHDRRPAGVEEALAALVELVRGTSATIFVGSRS
jgi:hypothetical protein